MIGISVFDSFIGHISILVLIIILIGLALKKLKQPYIVTYILVGVLLGEQVLGFIKDHETIEHLEEIGIILLLFFIGMEINLPSFLKKWKVAIFGTFLQVGVSLLMIYAVGHFYNWHFARIIVLGFVIALSSSAVIIKLLEEKNLIESQLGQNVLSILLTQDIIIVPMLIVTSFLGNKEEPLENMVLMAIGGIAIIGILVWIFRKGEIKLPFSKVIEKDHEIQLFVAMFFCFGGALISSFFGLSASLGAFVGGLIMHAGKATHWIHDALNSFRIVFVALFFISIGLQIDIHFIAENIVPILIVLVLILLSNHLINTLILRFFSCCWKDAFVGGAYLAQIGEFSFLLSFSAFHLGIIQEYGYNFTISLISLSLALSPIWIASSEFLIKKTCR